MRAALILWLWVQSQYHQFIVRGDLAYMAQLERGGILDGISLRAFRSAIAVREARVIALEADMRALRRSEARA